MKIRTKHCYWVELRSIGQIVEVLARLGWRAKEDTWMVVDDGHRGYAQAKQIKAGKYIAEWRGRFDKRHPCAGIYRAQTLPAKGKVRERGKLGIYNLYANDLLSLSQTADVLLSYWLKRRRPASLHWRSLSRDLERYTKAKAAGKVK